MTLERLLFRFRSASEAFWNVRPVIFLGWCVCLGRERVEVIVREFLCQRFADVTTAFRSVET